MAVNGEAMLAGRQILGQQHLRLAGGGQAAVITLLRLTIHHDGEIQAAIATNIANLTSVEGGVNVALAIQVKLHTGNGEIQHQRATDHSGTALGFNVILQIGDHLQVGIIVIFAQHHLGQDEIVHVYPLRNTRIGTANVQVRHGINRLKLHAKLGPGAIGGVGIAVSGSLVVGASTQRHIGATAIKGFIPKAEAIGLAHR